MAEATDFILPSENEKQSHKFILDSLRRRSRRDLQHTEPSSPSPFEFPDWSSLPLPAGKEFFRIREVADLLGLEPETLRAWESDFPVRPMKSGGQRVYRRADLETLRFLHYCQTEGLSVEETKQRLKAWRKQEKSVANSEILKQISTELKELIRLAQNPPGLSF